MLSDEQLMQEARRVNFRLDASAAGVLISLAGSVVTFGVAFLGNQFNNSFLIAGETAMVGLMAVSSKVNESNIARSNILIHNSIRRGMGPIISRYYRAGLSLMNFVQANNPKS